METSLGRECGCGGVVTACHCLVGLVVRLDGDDGVLSVVWTDVDIVVGRRRIGEEKESTIC